MTPRIKTLIVVATVAGLAATLAACGHRHKDPQQRAQWIMDKMERKLELNEAQKTKMIVVRDKMLAARADMHGEDDEKKQRMQEIIAGNTFDRSKAMTLFEEKTRAVETHGPEVINAMADFYDSLDQTQQQKLRDHLQQRMERYRDGGWGGHHGGHRGGQDW